MPEHTTLRKILPMAKKQQQPQQNKYALATASGGLGKDAIDMKYTADVLPAALKEAYDNSRDTSLDKEISKKRNDVMGGAIEGLNKYKDISDPFARRALAEKYQSGLSVGLDSLVTEKERRQKSFADYVNKWSGLFGAEAARRQSMAEEARRNTSTGLGKESKYNSRLNAIADEVRQGKYNRESAKEVLLREFPEANPNDIYTLVQDNYEKTPYSSKYFTPPAEKADDPTKWETDRGETEMVRSTVSNLRNAGYSDEEIRDELYKRGYGNMAKNFFQD